MKMILVFADATRLEKVRAALKEVGAAGYTVLSVAEGAGQTGVHTGDRVHPGALALVMVIEEDAKAEAMFDELVRRRDATDDHMSKLFLMPVLRQA
jgi:nitrogen regulatory protein PII